jgi:hypothetical protein
LFRCCRREEFCWWRCGFTEWLILFVVSVCWVLALVLVLLLVLLVLLVLVVALIVRRESRVAGG